MKKTNKILLLLALGVTSSLGSAVSANANTINMGEDAPTSATLELDDNDEVVNGSSEGSSNSILDIVNNSVNKFARSAIHYAHSSWTYYTDHHNYFNGYKEGHSNYLHRSLLHSSTAKVGSNKKTATAGAKKWSYATAKGKGNFTPSISAAFK